MRLNGLYAIAAVAMITVATSATAQTVDAARPSSLVAALQEGGYKAALDTDGSGDPRIKSAASGANFSIYFYGCTANTNCKSIQFSTSYTVKPKLTLQKINEWNAKNRFAQAYLDQDGDPVIQFDVVLQNGAPSRLFLASVERWTTAMGAFQTFIGW